MWGTSLSGTDRRRGWMHWAEKSLVIWCHSVRKNQVFHVRKVKSSQRFHLLSPTRSGRRVQNDVEADGFGHLGQIERDNPDQVQSAKFQLALAMCATCSHAATYVHTYMDGELERLKSEKLPRFQQRLIRVCSRPIDFSEIDINLLVDVTDAYFTRISSFLLEFTSLVAESSPPFLEGGWPSTFYKIGGAKEPDSDNFCECNELHVFTLRL